MQPKIDPRFLDKSLNSIGKIGSFGFHGILKITPLLDAILLPTWLHFGSQNPLKSRLGDVLRRLGGVLEVFGVSWGRLEASWEPLRASSVQCLEK